MVREGACFSIQHIAGIVEIEFIYGQSAIQLVRPQNKV